MCMYVCVCPHSQREEAGEVRHEVDFRQLKIENQQLSECCNEKNHELLRLKLSAANTLQILNTYKVAREREQACLFGRKTFTYR